jgi:hypothetical protein
MSQPFDDLYDQVQDMQNTAENNQPTIDAVANVVQPDGTIRAQLDYPLDPQSVQEIQEVVQASTTGGSVVSNAQAPFFPNGWSVSHTGTGIYVINHTLNTTEYAVTVSPNIFHTSFAVVCSKTSTSFEVATFVWSSGAATDTDFDFIVTY